MFIIITNGKDTLKLQLEDGKSPMETLAAYNQLVCGGVEEFRLLKSVESITPTEV